MYILIKKIDEEKKGSTGLIKQVKKIWIKLTKTLGYTYPWVGQIVWIFRLWNISILL